MRFLNVFIAKLPISRCLHSSRYFSQQNALKSGEYVSVIGLEVHAQITSQSKLFSGAPNDCSAPANTCVAFFDAATPGTLPRLNEGCVFSALKTSLALACDINMTSFFDRKHYFYADSPAGYQITQQRLPIAVNGEISFPVTNIKEPYTKSSKIRQIQLEQDSGKSLHFPESNTSLLDLNRAGVPLVEIVFEPDLSTGEEAASLLKELSLILMRLGTCSCEMHHGALRCDANISIHKSGDPLGVRTEVKNIGSIRAVAKAIDYEIKRQIRIVENGGRITNETRNWDANSGTTIVMRDKEVQQDYRFMPEPNLPPLVIHPHRLSQIASNLPEMPSDTREHLMQEYKFPLGTTETLVRHDELLKLFRHFVELNKDVDLIRTAAMFLTMTVIASCNKFNIPVEKCELSAKNFVDIVNLYATEAVNKSSADELFDKVIEDPTADAIELFEKCDMKQMNNIEEIQKLCQTVIDTSNPKWVRRARSGKKDELQKLMQKALELSNYKVNTKSLKQTMKSMLAPKD